MGNIPKLATCTMVNIGQQTIVYQANNTVLNKVKPPFTTLSYRVSKNDVDATVYGGLSRLRLSKPTYLGQSTKHGFIPTKHLMQPSRGVKHGKVAKLNSNWDAYMS